MWEIKFWFQTSNNFIWVGEHENLDEARKLAEKFASRNCSAWSWSVGKDNLIRGVQVSGNGSSILMLVSVAKE